MLLLMFPITYGMFHSDKVKQVKYLKLAKRTETYSLDVRINMAMHLVRKIQLKVKS